MAAHALRMVLLGAAAMVFANGAVQARPAAAGDGPGAGRSRPTSYPGGRWQPEPARYGATTMQDVRIPMDDGVVLTANVTYPAGVGGNRRAAGRFPVIIEHTPYLERDRDLPTIRYLAAHGYIYVKVWARGANMSGGEMAYFAPRDGLDGKAVVDWAARRLDGSDGRIGLFGCSWPGGLATTTTAFVGRNSPVKATIAACVGLTGLQRQTFMVSGLPTTRMRTSPDLLPAVGNTPSAQRVLGKLLDDMAKGGDPAYDREYWRERRPISLAGKIVDNGIPMLLWTGWKDFVDVGAIRTYIALQNASAGRPLDALMPPGGRTTPRYQIVAGGWGHTGGLDASIYLEWFETWLKGVDTGLQKSSTAMHLFEGGTGRWINLPGFPAVAAYSQLQLAAAGGLESGSAPQASRPLVWGDPAGPDGLLTFTTPPLKDGMTLAGPISATIFASSTNTNLALIAKLADVAPDGRATEISRGAVLGSMRTLDAAKTWRDSRGVVTWPWPTLVRDEYLTPGRTYRLEIALAPRAWGVAPGHRLRLELSTQSPRDICPLEGPPPGTSTEICGLTAIQQKTVPGGRYTIRFGGGEASTLNLPKLPFKAFAEARSGPAPMPASTQDQGTRLPLDWGGR